MDFLRSGAKASTINKGPVALVWKHCAICSASGAVGLAMAALLTSASSLSRMVTKIQWYGQGYMVLTCRAYSRHSSQLL